MNRTHRTIWSESRKAFVVTHEKAKARGKPSSTRKTIASAMAMAMALAAMAVAPAFAAPCPPAASNLITVSAAATSACQLGASDSAIVTNTGSINAGTGFIVTSVVAGSISNSGTVSGGATGIYLWGSSLSSISNSGTISGAGVGTGGGIYLNGSSSVGSISNSGTISASGATRAGIFINNFSAVTGGITNSGTISGTGSSGVGIRVSSTSTVSGGITNSGTISGGNTGILVQGTSTVSGGITNSGTITGTSRYGICLLGGSTVDSIVNVGGTISGGNIGIYLSSGTVGSITNSGTISGPTGIRVSNTSTVSGGITNSGTISGATNAIYADGTSTLPNINITGTAAHLIGNVFAQNTALNITAGASFTSQGTFDVGSFNIANTGTFNMAHGVTTATGFTNAGTLAVAAGTTATITGNYTQASTGIFSTGLATSATNYGKLVVTGTADLSASNKIFVNVTGTPTLAAGNVLTSVISAGTLTAGPTYTVTDNSALWDFTGATNGNAIDLTAKLGLTALGSVISTGSTSAMGAAAVFDTLLGGTATPLPTADMGTVITALGNLSSQAAVSNAVSQTLPLMTGEMEQAHLANLHGVNRIVQARQEGNRGLSSGDSFATSRNAWVKPIGSWADQKDRDGAPGYKAQTYGAAFGVDGEISQTYRIGAAFAYTYSNVDSNSGAQNAKVDSYQAVLYGSRSMDGNTECNWQADYGYNQNKGNRYIAFVARNAAADYSSSSFHLGMGVGRTIPMGEKTSFTPSFRADYTSIHDNGYTETGAGALNLVVNGKTTNEFILAVDGKVNYALSDTSTLIANLGVGHDAQARQSSITAAFQGGGAAFTTPGINPSSTLVHGGLGVVVKSGKGVEVTGRYDAETRTGFTGQTVSVKARWQF